MKSKKLTSLTVATGLAAVFAGSSGCTAIHNSAIRVSNSQQNGDVDILAITKAVDDFKRRIADGKSVTESEVIETFGKANAHLTLRGERSDYNDLFDKVHHGAKPETLAASEEFRRDMLDVHDYVLVCRNVATYGQLHYTTEVQTEKKGFDYTIQLVFKDDHLLMVSEKGRPDINEKDSDLPLKYIIDAAVGGAKSAVKGF